MSISDLFAGQASLVPSALRGYRTWNLLPDVDARIGRPIALHSTGVRHTWCGPNAIEHARCLGVRPLIDDGHASPDSNGCHCGLYGWYDPADTRIVDRDVFGVIAASGRVVMGTHGFRAEHARVLAVTTSSAAARVLLHERGYQVYETRDELLAAYPPDDVSDLVDHRCGGRCATQVLAPSLHVRIGVTGAVITRAAQTAGAAAHGAASAMRVLVALIEALQQPRPEQR